MSYITQIKNTIHQRGFTLVELLVVVSITALIASLALSAYPNYARKADLDTVVLDIALTLREAQVYGAGGREALSGENRFGSGYGVAFTEDSSEIAFFVDRNNDGVYDGATELERLLALKAGFKIASVCVDSACAGKTRMDITFKRPESSARVTVDGTPTLLLFNDAHVEIEAPTGEISTVKVYPTGQITTN